MDESIPETKKDTEKPNHKIIRITKIFDHNNKHSENVMVITNGKNTIKYNLRHKINQRNILESLKTIQNKQPNDNENSKIYYTSNRTQSKNDIYLKKKNNNKIFRKSKTIQNLNQLTKKESCKNDKNITSEKNIFNINTVDLGAINKMKKVKISKEKNKKVIFHGIRLLKGRESERDLMKKTIVNYPINSNINIFSNSNNNSNSFSDINNNLNNILASKKNMNKNLITNITLKDLSNNDNINRINDKNIDKISDSMKQKNNKNLIENEKLNNIYEKYINISSYDKMCIICERTYSGNKKIFSAKCNNHYFCRDCLKVYLQNLIEKGSKNMKCPLFKCKYDFELYILENILDKKYYRILLEKNNNDEEDEKTIIDDNKKNNLNLKINPKFNNKFKKMELYQNKNIFQVNPCFDLYNIKKLGDGFCPKCHEESLFGLSFTFFKKCLNCGYKCCKYCNKQFTNNHLIINDKRHCKVYYRRGKKSFSSINPFFKFVIQIIYIIGIYFILLYYFFILVNNILFLLLRIEKKKKKYSCGLYIKYFLSYFFSSFIYLMIVPFLFILIPFFPILISLIDVY